jgi:uncharacterized membrane protein
MAVAIAAGSIVVGWIIYDLLWRLVAPRSETAAGVLSVAALVAMVIALTQLLAGRAAFVHVGALLATIMAGNVAMTIMPSQRELVNAVAAGGTPDPAIAQRAKTRSIHNNYLTFPVIVLMVSNHFPGIYGQRSNWLALLVLIAAGAGVRHMLNVRYTFRRWKPALAGTIAVSLAVLFLLTRPEPASSRPDTADVPALVTYADARPIIDRRCAACHSQSPAITEFGPAPAGVAFDTPEQMQAMAPRIRVRAVETQTMPLGNRTHMTERERAILKRWLELGAPVR